MDRRILLEKGIECGCSDFVCAECVEARVEYTKQQHRSGDEAKVMCSKNKCTYVDRDLARLLPATAFVAYLESRQRLFEQRLAAENEEHIKQGVRDELERIAAMGARQRKSFFLS